ncbi:hypothetical protein COW64_21665 [bacterium (Candidatus Blackallbacteria) CG18_big_fil_WC_8_21_14_2_50_49_26]|nr:MAG: hypothetical protein COW64_21665 [bacterium (Candidatus Blackallbacteria) CG18_big_fil_WC_8_21_14_2_50_49_26]
MNKKFVKKIKLIIQFIIIILIIYQSEAMAQIIAEPSVENNTLSNEVIKWDHNFGVEFGIGSIYIIPFVQASFEYLIPFSQKEFSIVAQYKLVNPQATHLFIHVLNFDLRYSFLNFQSYDRKSRIYLTTSPIILMNMGSPIPFYSENFEFSIFSQFGIGMNLLFTSTHWGVTAEVKTGFVYDDFQFIPIISPQILVYYGF